MRLFDQSERFVEFVINLVFSKGTSFVEIVRSDFRFWEFSFFFYNIKSKENYQEVQQAIKIECKMLHAGRFTGEFIVGCVICYLLLQYQKTDNTNTKQYRNSYLLLGVNGMRFVQLAKWPKWPILVQNLVAEKTEEFQK